MANPVLRAQVKEEGQTKDSKADWAKATLLTRQTTNLSDVCTLLNPYYRMLARQCDVAHLTLVCGARRRNTLEYDSVPRNALDVCFWERCTTSSGSACGINDCRSALTWRWGLVARSA
jgi:hypothetical protein